jgi:hypothetical protein
MPKRSSKDPNISAFSIVQQVTNGTRQPFTDVPAALDNAELRKQVMREMGRLGGLKGGKARAASLSSDKKSQIARDAAKARWAIK